MYTQGIEELDDYDIWVRFPTDIAEEIMEGRRQSGVMMKECFIFITLYPFRLLARVAKSAHKLFFR